MNSSFSQPQVAVNLLQASDEADILAFERAGRAFFARTIGDRGDAFFAEYSQRHAELLAQMREGAGLFLLVRDRAGTLVGRVNFTQIKRGSAMLGYRFVAHASGRGYATAAVAQALAYVRAAGVREVRAVVALDNPASARVLEKVGFVRLEGERKTVQRGGEEVVVQAYAWQD